MTELEELDGSCPRAVSLDNEVDTVLTAIELVRSRWKDNPDEEIEEEIDNLQTLCPSSPTGEGGDTITAQKDTAAVVEEDIKPSIDHDAAPAEVDDEDDDGACLEHWEPTPAELQPSVHKQVSFPAAEACRLQFPSPLAAPSASLPSRKRPTQSLGVSASAPSLTVLPSEDSLGQQSVASSSSHPHLSERRGSHILSDSRWLVQKSSPSRPNAPKIVLVQDELRNLPDAEALRQILIESTGSLKHAYKAMNVNGGGVANCDEFEQGLQRARVFGSPLVSYKDAACLFRGIAPDSGILSLQELLGYMPYRARGGVRDTKVQWANYNNKTSAQKSRLARKPRWKAQRDLLDHSDHHVRQKRELKVQLLDARRRGNLRMEEKRRLVKGLVSEDERDEEMRHEAQRLIEKTSRIGEGIRACAKSRSELVMLQQAMAKLVSPEGGHRKRNIQRAGRAEL